MGQTLSLHLNLEKFSLKPVNRAFIAAEGLDLLTTFMGSFVFPQMWEANPMKLMLGGWIPLILAKIIATILVVTILQRVQKWPALVWIIPTAAFLPALWNMICILFELVL
jgi:hypothetical protein